MRRHIKRQCAAAWLAAAACVSPRDRANASRDVARLDSSASRSTVEGAAAGRGDPRDLAHGSVAGSPSPASMAADSAGAVEQRFQAMRAAINAAVRGLDTVPPPGRRSSAYAARFDSVRALTIAAESLRRVRDRWRKKAVVSGQ